MTMTCGVKGKLARAYFCRIHLQDFLKTIEIQKKDFGKNNIP